MNLVFYLQGMCGPNMEYLMKLVWCNRKFFPGHVDEHLDTLEQEVQEIASGRGDSLEKYSYENLHWPVELQLTKNIISSINLFSKF